MTKTVRRTFQLLNIKINESKSERNNIPPSPFHDTACSSWRTMLANTSLTSFTRQVASSTFMVWWSARVGIHSKVSSADASEGSVKPQGSIVPSAPARNLCMQQIYTTFRKTKRNNMLRLVYIPLQSDTKTVNISSQHSAKTRNQQTSATGESILSK